MPLPAPCPLAGPACLLLLSLDQRAAASPGHPGPGLAVADPPKPQRLHFSWAGAFSGDQRGAPGSSLTSSPAEFQVGCGLGRGGVRYKSCSVLAARLLSCPPGAGREGLGGPHGASSPPRLRSSGPALHTLSWLAVGCCLCAVRVVTVIQPPATWPQCLARMVVTTPWARAGAPKCVKVAVLGLGWRSGCEPGDSSGSPTSSAHRHLEAQRPASPKAQGSPQPARTGDGHHTGEHTANWASSALPALPPPASAEACPLFPGHFLNLAPDLSWPPAAFLQCLIPPASCTRPGQWATLFRTWVRQGWSLP